MVRNLHTSVSLKFHWPDPGHVATPNSKVGWEIYIHIVCVWNSHVLALNFYSEGRTESRRQLTVSATIGNVPLSSVIIYVSPFCPFSLLPLPCCIPWFPLQSIDSIGATWEEHRTGILIAEGFFLASVGDSDARLYQKVPFPPGARI